MRAAVRPGTWGYGRHPRPEAPTWARPCPILGGQTGRGQPGGGPGCADLFPRPRLRREATKAEAQGGPSWGGPRGDDTANGHASPQQLKDLVDQLRDDDTTLVSTLSPALQRLDERTRMLLIDQLLEASLIPH